MVFGSLGAAIAVCQSGGMASSPEQLRTLLREELAAALDGVKADVQKLQSGLSEALGRIQTLERASSWPSPRSALRSPSSSEPPRKSSRGSVGFSSPRTEPSDSPVSHNTFVLNTFPDKTSREEIKAWLSPLVQQLVGSVEFTVSSKTKYCKRVLVRFVSPMRAKAFAEEWRKEPRMFAASGAEPSRIYISWLLSPARAKEEFLHRQFYTYAKDVLQLAPPKLEKEKSTRTIYYDKVLLAKVEKEEVSLTTYGKTFAHLDKFHAWLAEKDKARPSL